MLVQVGGISCVLSVRPNVISRSPSSWGELIFALFSTPPTRSIERSSFTSGGKTMQRGQSVHTVH
jgi:hypothetical protein